jgi:hypothetical protein
MAGGAVKAGVERVGRIVECDAQPVERRVLAEILMDEMRSADVFAIDPVLPAAPYVIGRMPEAIGLDVANPREPSVDHLRAASRHAGKRRDRPLAVVQHQVAGFEREVPGPQQIVGVLEAHRLEPDPVAALDRVNRLFDARQKLHEHGRIWRRATVLGIAGVQMEN